VFGPFARVLEKCPGFVGKINFSSALRKNRLLCGKVFSEELYMLLSKLTAQVLMKKFST
jgi:hypothetical protein